MCGMQDVCVHFNLHSLGIHHDALFCDIITNEYYISADPAAEMVKAGVSSHSILRSGV